MVKLESRSRQTGVAACGVIACCLLCFLVQAAAQCPVRQSDAAQGEPLLPESGLLSEDTYTNLYFGFMLRLPITVSGHRLMVPITLPGEHALLAIGFQQGNRYGTLKITAGGYREPDDKRMTLEQAQQREDDIARSKGEVVPERRLNYAPPAIRLKRADRSSGEVRGTQYTARIRNYTVRFTIQANDQAFLKKARESVSGLRAFCTDDAGRFFTKDGKAFAPEGTPTTGPTIPTAVVDEAMRSRPAERTIPEGAFANGSFQAQGLEFALPRGWNVMPTPPDKIADDARDEVDRRLTYLWKACARTWLLATGSGSDAVTLRVLDQSCLALPFPASAGDTLSAESLGEYLQMLGKFGKIKSNRVIQQGGKLFAVYDGTVAEGPSGEELSHRHPQVIAVTRYNKLIFAWSWSAPTMSELQRVPMSDANFGDSAPISIGPTLITSQNSSQR